MHQRLHLCNHIHAEVIDPTRNQIPKRNTSHCYYTCLKLVSCIESVETYDEVL
jgi:hypothetical protein